MTNKQTMRLMDVVTAYLCGTLDTEIYMKAPPELLKRIAFHILGERNSITDIDLQARIQQITPTENQRGLYHHSGPTVQQNPSVLHTPQGYKWYDTGKKIRNDPQ